MYSIWTTIFLLICAATDIRFKKVYVFPCVVNAVAVVLVRLLREDFTLKSIVGAGGLLLILVIISVLSKSSFGIGDSLVIGVVCLTIDVAATLEIMVFSLVLCIIFSLAALAFKKLTTKSVIPFVPFLFLGNIVTIVLEGGIM